MDEGTLVDAQISAGAKLAAAVDASYAPVAAAFWLKDVESLRWHFYLVSETFNEANLHAIHGNIRPLLGPRPHTWLGSTDIKALGTNHPVAKDVIEMQQKYPSLFPKRTRSTRLGGVTVEDGYIYALPIAEPV